MCGSLGPCKSACFLQCFETVGWVTSKASASTMEHSKIQLHYYYTTLHPLNGLFSRTTWISRYQKSKTSLDLKEVRDDGVLGCSGISWTMQKNLHLTPLIFYRLDALPDAQQNSVKTQKVQNTKIENNRNIGTYILLYSWHWCSPTVDHLRALTVSLEYDHLYMYEHKSIYLQYTGTRN